MKNIKLTIEYDGSGYAGWQRQENAMTVQQKLEEALERLCGEHVKLVGSGRTDSGVHAKGQVANFYTSSTIPADRFSYALNSLLPYDIRINQSEEVAMDFHARFSATGKKYRYSILNNIHGTAIGWQYLHHISLPLDIQAMKDAAGVFKGTYDYAAFMATGSPVHSTVRTIYKSELIQNGNLLHFIVTGNGFLYNMVRIMAGTLIDVGRGKISASEIPDIIASRDRKRAGATAPASGLFLEEVYYDKKLVIQNEANDYDL
jgi:tRNA pseudouridine38-40 synthase